MGLLREEFRFTAGGRVDTSGAYPIIRGVHLCGLDSEHGYSYLPTAWTDDVLRQYEGADSYDGHKDGVRLPSEKVGWFENVRRRADGSPEADYVLDPDHPLTPRLVRAAQHRQSGYALSHTAHISKWGTRNGRRVVEAFARVHTVDVVSRGGTTGGLFESAPVPRRKPAPPPGPSEGELIRECFALGLSPTPLQFRALKGLPNEAQRTAFVREQAAFVKAAERAAGVEAARQRFREYARRNQS